MAYATLDEVYLLALSARAFVVGASKVESTEIATGTIRLQAHGLSASDQIIFSATSGGALPAELSAFVYYNPILVGADLFKVAHPTTGLPIIFTTTPSGWAVAVDSARRLTVHLHDAFGRINNCLTAHSTPILVDPVTGLYPAVLIGMNARMAARSCVTSLQFENAAYKAATDRLFALEASDNATLAEWKAGKPIMPQPTDQTDVADNGARAGYDASAPPWITSTL